MEELQKIKTGRKNKNKHHPKKARINAISNKVPGKKQKYTGSAERKQKIIQKEKSIMDRRTDDKHANKLFKDTNQTILQKNKKLKTYPQKSKLLFCKDKNGQLEGGKEEMLQRWVEYFKKMLSEKNEIES